MRARVLQRPTRWIAGVSRLVGALALVMAGLSLGACEAAPRAREASASGPRVDAIPARTLVVPLDDTFPLWAGSRPAARLDDGTRVEASIVLATVRVLPDRPDFKPRRDDWLPSPGIWTTEPFEVAFGERRMIEKGSRRLLVLQMPDRPVGRVLTVASKEFAVNWLSTPEEVLAATGDEVERAGGPWTPTLARDGAVSPLFASLAWPEGRSPLTRWRYRLLTDGLRPGEPVGQGRDLADAVQAFEDTAIESLARQNEDRWSVGLGRLWLENPDLAMRLRRRLTTVVNFGGGVVAPAWSADHGAMDQVLDALIAPDLEPARRARRIEDWLSDQPTFLAWVVDDAGTLDAVGGGGVGTVAIANLGDLPTLAHAALDDAQGPRELRPLAAQSSLAWLVTLPKDRSRGKRPATITARAGSWEASLSTTSARVPVEPPGLRLGPLAHDWSMESWLAAAPRAAPASYGTAGWLHSPGADGTLELFVECRVPPDRPGSATGPVDTRDADVVRVWLGPTTMPTSVLRITRAGTVSEEAPGPRLVRAPASVRIVEGVDRWSFRLPIPTEVVERDGALRLGLTRDDPTGRRAAFPRPMMPWQREPGRLAIDTKPGRGG